MRPTRKFRGIAPTCHALATTAVLGLALLASACSQEPPDSVELLDSVEPPESAEPATAEVVAVVGAGNERDQLLRSAGRVEAYEGELKSLADINVRDARLERVLPPINYPFAFEFTGEREILLTEHGGRLMRFNLETGEGIEITGLPPIGSGFSQIGLMDIALHPDYANNKRVYFSYAKAHPEIDIYHYTEVATAVIVDDTLAGVTDLLNTDDYGWASSNFGGALEFDDAGYLYVSVGERGEDPLPQKGHRLEGKILRLNADGSVPQDNPFVDTPGFDPRIWALGVRNPQGLAYDSVSGLLFEAEHGPLGGDEVNVIRPGGNYGYPTIGYGSNYATGKPMGESTHRDGMLQPVYYFLPSIAASKIEVYRGDMFREWDGDLLVTALKAEHVAKLDFDNGVVRTQRALLQEVGGRIRDIKVAADGSIYILSQTTGLHRLFRPPPPPPPAPAPAGAAAAPATPAAPPADAPHPGKQYYDIICSGCHDGGATGAPVLGDYARWQPIMEQPLELTKERVLNGYNAMPERGMCHFCSEFGLMQMVDYMFVKAKENAP